MRTVRKEQSDNTYYFGEFKFQTAQSVCDFIELNFPGEQIEWDIKVTKRTKIYKMLRPDMMSATFGDLPPSIAIQYKLNELITPKWKGSRMYVYTDLYEARAFRLGSPDYPIFEGYTDSEIELHKVVQLSTEEINTDNWLEFISKSKNYWGHGREYETVESLVLTNIVN